MNEELKKRIKSFLWRVGGMLLVSTITFLISPEMLDAFKSAGIMVPSVLVVLAGYVLNELTKALNK